jgi:pyruvate dehydrogenase E1 component alpha subunit
LSKPISLNLFNIMKSSTKLTHSKDFALSTEQWAKSIETMLLLRRFEEKCGQFYGMGKIAGFCHLYTGQEAVVTAAGLAREPKDSIITSYRDHAHAIVCGISPGRVLAELMGRSEGSSRGKGGSMHLFSKAHGFYGGHGIVGAQVPLGTGIALAHKYNDTKGICYTFFGDGAANQGQVFEAFNMAQLWSLPVLYVLENNGYAIGTSVARSTKSAELHSRGEVFGIKGESVDGMRIDLLYEAFSRASKFVRTSGPALIEARTYRFKGHSMSDPATYRSKDEVDSHKQRDPIAYAKGFALENDILTEADLKIIEDKVKVQIKEAVAFAEASPYPDPKELFTDVYVA